MKRAYALIVILWLFVNKLYRPTRVTTATDRMGEIVTVKYISCACNATGHCADWGRNGLICFGTSHAVALYKPKV